MSGPKLLDKRTVNAEVATQRKHEIKTGLVLAKKVDALRETLQAETGNLEKFRSETIAQVQRQIDVKIGEMTLLEGNLVVMRQEYEKLLTPPDLTEEREKLRKRALNLEHEFIELGQTKQELEHGIHLNTLRERNNQEEWQRVSLERERSVLNLTEASLLKEMSTDIMAKARVKSDAMILEVTERDSKSLQREMEVANRERVVESETKRLAKVAKQQKMKDEEIKDKYETLQRDIKRMKK